MKNIGKPNVVLRWILCGIISGVVILTAGCASSEGVSPGTRPSRSQPVFSSAFSKWSADDALQAFQATGLRFEIPHLSKDERDAFSGIAQVSSRQFLIPNQGSDARGIILSFQNARDLRETQAYYAALGNALPQYRSWVFVQDNLLLQINGDVPEAVAKQYAAALDALKAW